MQMRNLKVPISLGELIFTDFMQSDIMSSTFFTHITTDTSLESILKNFI